MNTTHVTSTGIAVAVAVAFALGLLFFGPRLLSPFSSSRSSQTATTTDVAIQATSTTAAVVPTTQTTMNPEPIPNPLPTTLTVTDTLIGTGAEAASGKQVSVNYTGYLPDGTVFDSSIPRGQAFTFNLGAGQVIRGWDQGIVGMKVGGKRRLIIPASLAYGNQAVGGVIPANATLIFDVELLDVK